MMLKKPNLGFRHVLAVIPFAVLILALSASAPLKPFPEVIPLPDGFQPEGIAAGNGTTFFVGSIPTGAIFRGDFRTGEGEVIISGQAGRQAIGLKFDQRTRFLYVAGGPTGQAFVYDAETGADVASIPLSSNAVTFINDVVVTRQAVYFTDSFNPVYYRLPLANDGSLPHPTSVKEISLQGDYEHVPSAFNLNGIVATPNGETLIAVSSVLGAIYRIDPLSGHATRLDLGGETVPNGDGILLHDKTLYVVQNFLNQISVVKLDPHLNSGTITQVITSPHFRIPTTVAIFGNALYVVNARFDTPPTPETEYEVVRVLRH
jgi:sugar lactone lactonase YvrE